MANLDINTASEHVHADIDKEQLAILFSEIGSEANILEEMLLEHSESAATNLFHATISLTQKIGYLADKGAGKSGGILTKGGASDWFIPPMYHYAARGAQETNTKKG